MTFDYLFIFFIILYYIPFYKYPEHAFSQGSAFYRVIAAIIVCFILSVFIIIPWINLYITTLLSIIFCYVIFDLKLKPLLAYNDTFFWLAELGLFVMSFAFNKSMIKLNKHKLIWIPNIHIKKYNSKNLKKSLNIAVTKPKQKSEKNTVNNLGPTGTEVPFGFKNINLYEKKGYNIFCNIKHDLVNSDSIELFKIYPIFTSDFIKQLENKLKGFTGEDEVLKQLNELRPNNSICLHNACFKNSNITAKEIDFILITPYGICIIESKYRTCNTIKFERYDYYEYPNKNDEKYENPIFQLLAQKNYLQDFLINNGFSIPVYELLVFSGTPELVLKQPIPINPTHICKCNDLCKLLENTFQNLEQKIKYKDIEKIADLIIKECKFPKELFLPDKNDYIDSNYFHFAECHSHLPMIPRHYWENGKDKFFLICPETKQLKNDDWTCGTLPLKIKSN